MELLGSAVGRVSIGANVVVTEEGSTVGLEDGRLERDAVVG